MIVFRGNRQQIRNIANQFVQILAGRQVDRNGLRRGFLLSVGFGVLSDIKDSFITKARGGTDEMGIRWSPLQPATIARRRVGPRDRQNQEIAERENVRRRVERRLFVRLRASLGEGAARTRARRAAAQIAFRVMGKKKAEILGGRDVEILRDTGVLFNSLSPGFLNGRGATTFYSRPLEPGGENQIFDVLNNGVIVGTSVKYAASHQLGDASRNLPARPFLPPREQDIPESWWNRWLRISIRSLAVSADEILRREGDNS